METLPAGQTSSVMSGVGSNKTYILRIAAVGPEGTVIGVSNTVKVRTPKK